MPLQEAAFRGAAVNAVFDNLLPDSPAVRKRVAEKTGAQGVDTYSLLAEIGRDCVGAMQFLPDGLDVDTSGAIEAEPISDAGIETLLANLAQAPLGVDPDEGFRISIAGAQEKTALLFYEGQWKRPIGATPTTHILKPQLGRIPTASGEVDLSHSVDNEHYCLALMRAFGLPNGKSLILGGEAGVDAQGAVGVRGQVDRRLLPLLVGTLFAGAITTLGQVARDGERASGGLLGDAGDAAAIEGAQVGGRLVDRELEVRPSIRLRAGATVRVMITRDLILEPYRP